MNEGRDLAGVLADARADAAVLERHGRDVEAVSIRRLCDTIEQAAHEYLAFLPELEAALFSGESTRTLHRRFAGLAARGHAYAQGRVRYYRQCMLRQRPQVDAAFLRGQRAAEEGTAA